MHSFSGAHLQILWHHPAQMNGSGISLHTHRRAWPRIINGVSALWNLLDQQAVAVWRAWFCLLTSFAGSLDEAKRIALDHGMKDVKHPRVWGLDKAVLQVLPVPGPQASSDLRSRPISS